MNDIKGIIEDVEKSSLVSNKVIKKVIEIIGQEKWQDINDEEDDTIIKWERLQTQQELEF